MTASRLSKALRAIQELVARPSEAIKALLLTAQHHGLVYRDGGSSGKIRNYEPASLGQRLAGLPQNFDPAHPFTSESMEAGSVCIVVESLYVSIASSPMSFVVSSTFNPYSVSAAETVSCHRRFEQTILNWGPSLYVAEIHHTWS